MGFKISNEEFYQIFGNPNNVNSNSSYNQKDKDEYNKKLRSQLISYLSTKKYPSARALLKWLNKGGSFTTMSCRADVVNDLEEEFMKTGVAFTLFEGVSGNYGFLARSCDIEKQNKAIKNVLERKSKYCNITSGEEAAYFYSKKSGLKDTDMVAIGGLNEEEVHLLKESCNKVLPNQTIGIDEMSDGSYLLTFHGKSSLDFTSDSNMATALVESLVTLNGNSAKIIRNKTKSDIAYQKEFVNGFPDKNGSLKNSVWIVGNERRYVERTTHGFKTGYPVEKDEDIILEEDSSITKDDENYNRKLHSALARISNKKCLYTEADVKMYFKIRKPYIENIKVAGEKQLISIVGKIVSENLNRSHLNTMDKKWDSKLDLYKKEVAKILESAQKAKVPKGYKKKDIIAIMAIAKNYGLKLDALSPAIQRMSIVNIYDRSLQRPVIKDIDKELNRVTSIAKERSTPSIEEKRKDMER